MPGHGDLDPILRAFFIVVWTHRSVPSGTNAENKSEHPIRDASSGAVVMTSIASLQAAQTGHSWSLNGIRRKILVSVLPDKYSSSDCTCNVGNDYIVTQVMNLR